MRSSFLLLVLLPTLITSLLSACKKHDPMPGEGVRVAMLAYGTTFEDHAFLQSCKTGLQNASTGLGVTAAYQIDTTSGQYAPRLEAFAKAGYQMVIAVGYMWNDAIGSVAPKYPGTRFVLVDSELPEPKDNALSILFDVDEVAYPLGFLSAWWAAATDPGDPAIAFVGAVGIPQVRQFSEPFLNGAARFNQQYTKQVSVHGVYAGTFIDQARGAQLADSLFSLGADVILGVGGLTGNGALYKAGELEKQAIGVDVDQYYSLPGVAGALLSSAMKNLDKTIFAVIQSYVEGKFTGGGIYTGNLANHGVQMAPYHDYEPLVPDSVQNAIALIRAGIIDGSIQTGWPE